MHIKTWKTLPSLSILVFVVVGLAAVILYANLASAQEDPEVEQLLQTSRTKTIGDITVTLSEATKDDDLLGIQYSYQVDDPDIGEEEVLAFGAPKVMHPDGSVTRLQDNIRVNETTEVFKFDLSSNIPGGEDLIDVQVGWYVIPRHGVSSTANIAISSEYASAMEGEETYIEVTLNANMSAGGRTYRVTKLFLDKGIGFGLIVVPTNDKAKKMALGSVGPMEVTLNDNLGTAYSFLGSGSDTIETSAGIEVESQQFNFLGEVNTSATSLTFTIEGGGGEVVGPFVFDNIALVSEDIPPTTPTPPGGVGPGDPIPTPPNVND